jgi:putative endonuclease
MNPRHALGLAAEDAAATWLEREGWSLLARRLRTAGGGEVDLVMRDPGGILVAIEVRARRTERAGRADGSVDARRIGRIRRTLVAHAAASRTRHGGLRVDLVTLEPDDVRGRWRMRRLPGVG